MPRDYPSKDARPSKGSRKKRPARPGRHRGRLPYTTQAGDGVVVNGYSEGWLGQGFPWVYQDEVVARTGELLPGRVVSIRARDGRVLGTGVWDEGHVEVRRFRTDEGPIDAELLRQRVVAARVRRSIPPNTTAWRWVHGENDQLPGIRIDVWDTDVAITLDSPSLMGLLEPLLDVIADERELRAAWLSWRPAAGEAERFAGLSKGRIWGSAEQVDIPVQERGMTVLVRPWTGHDAGLFCDMRDVRAWMAPHWMGRRVLNTFAYTGAFSVAAALAGATEVVSVDLSAPILARAKANFSANGLDPGSHRFVEADVFKALDTLRRKGEDFDIVIADPPSFSHGPEGLFSTAKALPRLFAACLRVLAPGGWLIAATNNGKISPKDFQRALSAAGRKLGRPLRVIHEGSTPIDFPADLGFPESRYLKCWVVQS